MAQYYVDYNILSPQKLDELLFSPFQQAIGKYEWERIQRQIRFYEYYEGKQHEHPETGRLVKAKELPRPAGLDYDPTRYATNYFKVFIQKKSRWQMGGNHTVHVIPKQIDPPEVQAAPDYVPSPEQERENKRAQGYEQLLRQLWKENRMREKLLQAARDRLIAGRVGCKILFNQRTGRIHWVFRPDYEIFPVFSNDDFEELLAVHFVHAFEDEEGNQYFQKQTFSLENDGFCYIEETVHDEELNLVRTITPKSNMGIDFIPVVLFPVTDLSGNEGVHTEPDDMKEQTDILNKLNEDAIDSLRFEMFSMTALLNVPEGTADKMKIAPGAVLELAGGFDKDGKAPDIKKVEGGFRWKDAYKDVYNRVKSALHEITGIPNITPNELDFGGINGEALHLLFHSIISETEEHWLVWQERLQELHAKTIRYLQARLNAPNFAYDKETVRAIGNDYDNEIKFALPLPENRRELVELLALETSNGFESIAGAMRRLGVEDVRTKQQEINNEKQAKMQLFDPYRGTEQGGQQPPTGDGDPNESPENEEETNND
jgi:hypothetical protein